MNLNYNQLFEMIKAVAQALGDELLNEVAFVGGCTTSLLLTDSFSLETTRLTDDVDLIINVVGTVQWGVFQNRLRKQGFSIDPEDEVICRMRLGELKVDFMPDDKSILGFSNRWYKMGLETAQSYKISESIVIRILTPPYFIATKLEAYLGRGNNDPQSSRDMEDILTLIDGREEVIEEIASSDANVREYIAMQISLLLEHPDFDYAVQGATRSNAGREALIFSRLDAIKSLAGCQ